MSDARSLKEELTANPAPRVHRTIVLGLIVGQVLILISIVFKGGTELPSKELPLDANALYVLLDMFRVVGVVLISTWGVTLFNVRYMADRHLDPTSVWRIIALGMMTGLVLILISIILQQNRTTLFAGTTNSDFLGRVTYEMVRELGIILIATWGVILFNTKYMADRHLDSADPTNLGLEPQNSAGQTSVGSCPEPGQPIPVPGVPQALVTAVVSGGAGLKLGGGAPAQAGFPTAVVATGPQLAPNGIFISYTHKDKGWLERINKALRPLVHGEYITVWDDGNIPPGSAWLEEIDRAIASARIAVLLVSQEFLASSFIQRKELPDLLRRRGEGMGFFWVPLESTPYKFTVLKDIQAAWRPDRPLITLGKAELADALAEIATKLAEWKPARE
jgi:hypothetical protein